MTVHAGYAEVPDLISEQRIAEVIELTREAHQKLLGKEPRIAVCGLNPHAGENGLFGNSEEEKIILPAIQKMRNKGCDLTGPLPPDTAFTESRRREIDAHALHVPRPGSHPRQGPCLRRSGQRHPRTPNHTDLG